MDVSALTALRPTTAAAAGGTVDTPKSAVNDPEAADRKKVSQQFEAILVRQLLGKTMSSMLGSKESTAGSVYGDMLTDSMATQLSAGLGLGLGRMLERQLAPRVHTAATPLKPSQP